MTNAPTKQLTDAEVLALEEVTPRLLWREADEPMGYVIGGRAWGVGWAGEKQVRYAMPMPAHLRA